RRAAALLGHLAHVLDNEAGGREHAGRPGGREQLEAERVESPRNRYDGLLVLVPHRQEGGAARREPPTGGALRLGERGRQVGGAGHDLSGRAHLGPEHGVGAGEAGEGEHRGLDRDLSVIPWHLAQVELREGRARRETAGGLYEVDARRLACERDGARGARVRLKDEELPFGERELDV